MRRRSPLAVALAPVLSLVLALTPLSAVPFAAAAPGGIIETAPVPLELPVEVETELSPAGSLKQAPLWKEIKQLLEHPEAQSCVPSDNTAGRDCVTTAPVQRRPGFGAAMPPLNVYPLDFNVLTGQPMRLRTSDGEISWDEPGPLFAHGDFADPLARPIIGYLVTGIDGVDGFENDACPAPAGCLVVDNTTGDADIPPSGTVVAVPGVIGGELHEFDPATGERTPIEEFEAPLNEEDFFRLATDTAGVPAPLQPYLGRLGAETLGKAAFWDMQVGSDGVQACGTCHFVSGVDNRTRNQLNPNHLGGDNTLQVKGPNQTVVAGDFPFHKLADPDVPGEPQLNPGNVVSDANDVMSSMGVKFRQFVDIPPIGTGANQSFGPAVNGVRPLMPDLGNVVTDPIAAAFVDSAPGATPLDSFNRACLPATLCPLGPNWQVQGSQTATGRFAIQNNQVRAGGTPGWAYWNAASFGPNQQAFFTFTNVAVAATEQDLFLKIIEPPNSPEAGTGLIEVLYNAPGGQVSVLTYDAFRNPQWVTHGAFPATFAAGDSFGARTLSDGTVTVFKNGAPVGSVDVDTGPNPWRAAWVAGGGKIGVQFTNAGGANGARFDDFGGGTVSNASDPFPVGGGGNLRRVEPRNTPTFHAAAFNFDNFWDGRARFQFNGGSVFGASDPQAHIFVDPAGGLVPATNGLIRPDLYPASADPADRGNQPVRIPFSSLGSQATGPPLSDFEMSFLGRNWPKIGKKLLQSGVTPLANQLVATDDSRLGPFSNQGGSVCAALGRATAVGKPGLCVSYPELIRAAFKPDFWQNTTAHLNGAANPADPFDGYTLTIAAGAAAASDRNQFAQMEANFSLFFGLGVQAYEQLTIPDNTPADRFMDANPRAGNGVGQPGEQGTLPPSQIPALVGPLTLIPDDPTTPEFDGFGPDELFGFDIFSGANLTAALPPGSVRNPTGVGSNPFLRSARCMLCHLGPEQTDHTSSVAHGFLLSDTEFELPPPGAAEPTGPFKFVSGFILSDELEGPAQDGVEVENRNFSVVNGIPAGTNYPASLAPFAVQIGLPNATAFQDNGIYNIGLRPTAEDISRGGDDPFGWPLALASLALKNLAGPGYQTCDSPGDPTCTGALANFDPDLGPGGGLFEETGEGALFPGTAHELESINPGLEMAPANPLMPAYMAPWLNNLPAGELHPQIDELAFAPNTLTHTPFAEFGEVLFGSDQNCIFDEATQTWGARCPNTQSAVPNNFDPPLNGTWPFANRVEGNGAFKAPQLRNVALTGPYFHTGSYLTLRQVVDFYMRGGDFPVTNGQDRDPNLVDVEAQVFGFGSTNALRELIDAGIIVPLDGIPDTLTLYDAMPDTDHPNTPEPGTSTPEAAKEALVKYLLSLTDPRVKFERAPFDRPEIFVPLDGRAPDNTGGRTNLVSLSGTTCAGAAPAAGDTTCFRQVAPVGAGGNATATPNFLGVANAPVAGPGNDHFDR
jgi:cytochrome c peroxidase